MNRHSQQSSIAYTRRTSPEASTWFMSGLMTFLVEGRDSAESFSGIEYRARPGAEPPPHVHTREDEFLYVLEGRLDVFVDSETFSIGPGECVFLPRNRPHAFRIHPPTARMLTVIQPAGLEGFFHELSEPATTFDAPTATATGSTPDVARLVQLAREYGLSFLSEDEIGQHLPSLSGRQPRARMGTG